MATRLTALLVAVAMVSASLAVRSALDRREGGQATESRLVCSTELADACAGLAERSDSPVRVVVEPAAATAARLATDDAGGPAAALDGWLVPAPWPDIVRGARQRAGLEPLLGTGSVLARSPMVLAVWPERAAVLRQRCPQTEVTWRCWGDLAGSPWQSLGGQPTWGQVKPGHGRATEALGLLAVGAATTGFFARSDLVRADLEESDAFRAWLARLERSVPTFSPSAGTALRDMLLKGPAAFDAVATSEAEAGPSLATTARPDKPALIYPSPVVTADVVLATVPGDGGRRLARAVEGGAGRGSLARSGWRVRGQPRARGVPAQPDLPAVNGLPPAGVLDALRALSAQVSR